MAARRSRKSKPRKKIAIYKGKRNQTRMAKGRRRGPSVRPWHVAGILIAASVAVGVFLWRPPAHRTDDLHPPVSTVANTWRAGPGDIAAFSDTMSLRSIDILAGLGVPTENIRVRRLPEHRNSAMRWELASNIPEDIPLAVSNLWLTRLAKRLGGSIIEGRENLKGAQLSLLVGLDDQRTNLITLRRNPYVERTRGRIALIIDDCGYQQRALLEAFCALPVPVTVSIFPGERETSWMARRATNGGHEVMVHLPMEPIDYPKRDPGQGAVFAHYDYKRIRTVTRAAIEAVPGAKGLNNHMGSRVTEDRRVIGYVLDEIKAQDLYFVDSVTSPHSIAYNVSLERGIPAGRNTQFLDLSDESERIAESLRSLSMKARQHGTAIGIAHAKATTLATLQDIIPRLRSEGFEFVTVSQAIR